MAFLVWGFCIPFVSRFNLYPFSFEKGSAANDLTISANDENGLPIIPTAAQINRPLPVDL